MGDNNQLNRPGPLQATARPSRTVAADGQHRDRANDQQQSRRIRHRTTTSNTRAHDRRLWQHPRHNIHYFSGHLAVPHHAGTSVHHRLPIAHHRFALDRHLLPGVHHGLAIGHHLATLCSHVGVV